jgi:hypothetical protein
VAGLSLYRRYDFFWGQANALIGDLHAAIPRSISDLLGAVGMSVKPRLAHQKFEPPPQFVADGIYGVADIL